MDKKYKLILPLKVFSPFRCRIGSVTNEFDIRRTSANSKKKRICTLQRRPKLSVNRARAQTAAEPNRPVRHLTQTTPRPPYSQWNSTTNRTTSLAFNYHVSKHSTDPTHERNTKKPK